MKSMTKIFACPYTLLKKNRRKGALLSKIQLNKLFFALLSLLFSALVFNDLDDKEIVNLDKNSLLVKTQIIRFFLMHHFANQTELIKSCIKQNRKAQEELYNLYKKPLFALCLKYAPNEAEAEDNLHNTFIEIFTNIKKFKGEGSFEGWMKRIAINKAIDSYKKSYQLSPISTKDYPDTEIEENELDGFSLDYILALVQGLPNQYRVVFCLYELDGYSHQEIAKILGISIGTSKSNLHRAKINLKEQIAPKKAIHNTSRKYGK